MKSLMIAGLGEPGPEHGRIRRNIGFAVMDALADYFNLVEAAERPAEKYEFGRVQAHGENGEIQEVLLVKHMNPMDAAGAPIAGAARAFDISPECILLVHAETDLAFGDARLKRGGAAGNHRGLRDVVQALGTPDFHHLRVGIGPSKAGTPVIDYMEAPFTKQERVALDDYVDECVQHCQEWLFRLR